MTEKSTFARRVRAAKPRAAKYEVRDDVVSGLALAIQPTGVRTWFLARMVRGRRRYATIGSADAMTIPEARREARRLIASYIEPAKTDSGPRTPGHPMDAFAAEFLDRQARHWKPRTQETNARIVRKDILPAFGHLTVDAIAVEQVRDWFASMAGKPGSANRAMPTLSVMMRMAELWGYRRHNSNPCKNTRRYKTQAKERFLTAEEMARLNAVLTRDEFWCPHIVAIVRLLMLTGCRFGEIAALEWRSRATARIARISFPPVRRRDPSTRFSASGSASATRPVCPPCGCTTFAIIPGSVIPGWSSSEWLTFCDDSRLEDRPQLSFRDNPLVFSLWQRRQHDGEDPCLNAFPPLQGAGCVHAPAP